MDTQTLGSVSQAERPRWLVVLRDVAIFFALTFFGGFVVGVICAMLQVPSSIVALAGANLITSTIGFFIAGLLTTRRRWQHLGIVAVGAWATGLVNVAFGGTSVGHWMGSIVFIFATMGIGGGLASLLRKADR